MFCVCFCFSIQSRERQVFYLPEQRPGRPLRARPRVDSLHWENRVPEPSASARCYMPPGCSSPSQGPGDTPPPAQGSSPVQRRLWHSEGFAPREGREAKTLAHPERHRGATDPRPLLFHKQVSWDFVKSGDYALERMGVAYPAQAHLKSPFDPGNRRVKGIY